MIKAGRIQVKPSSAEFIRLWKLAYPKLTEDNIDAVLDTKDYHLLVWSKGKLRFQLFVSVEDLKTLTPEDIRDGGSDE